MLCGSAWRKMFLVTRSQLEIRPCWCWNGRVRKTQTVVSRCSSHIMSKGQRAGGANGRFTTFHYQLVPSHLSRQECIRTTCKGGKNVWGRREMSMKWQRKRFSLARDLIQERQCGNSKRLRGTGRGITGCLLLIFVKNRSVSMLETQPGRDGKCGSQLQEVGQQMQTILRCEAF